MSLAQVSSAKRNSNRPSTRELRSEVAWDAQTEGSAQRLQANYCMMEATAKRANELEALLRSSK